MPLHPLRGHDDTRSILARAVLSGTLPQSILLYGPGGIGKQRLALWLGQMLVCESPSPEGPCGRCVSCRMTQRLEHPDVHWFFPLPRPQGATPDKLREKLEQARAAELELRRANPLHLPAYDRPPAHFLAAVQTLQQLAGVRPAMGARKVFVVGDAEAMVPQESSPEAANAFLKLLEEPPSGTTLILTSAHPGALLPTVLSRVLPVRLLPLREESVARCLVETNGIAPEEAHRIAALAEGSIGRALRLLPADDGPGELEAQRQTGRDLLLAALSDSAVSRLAAAHALPPTGARGDFLGVLDAVASWLRDLLAMVCGAPEQVVNRDAKQQLAEVIRSRPLDPLGVGRAIDRVGNARDRASGNVNPQLIMAHLLRGIQADLRSPR